MSDTHEGYYGSRAVPIWQMDGRYEQAVTERLSDRFGEVESDSLAGVLMETARNAVEDNLQDYTAQLKEDEVRANLPTVDEQIEMMVEAEDMRNESAGKSSASPSLGGGYSQEDIDSILIKGSGFQDSKYRIYRQFQKQEDSKSNIDFLKREYGTGSGNYHFSDGRSGHFEFSGKGFAIDRETVLTWSKAEKRLRELIKNNRYFSPKEKDRYADYLEGISAPQYEIDSQRKAARQRFIDAHRDLPPADKRDTLSLRLSDFIRDLDGYEKNLLENVGRTDFGDMITEQMEQALSDPATVQQLIDFLALVQRKTSSVYSRSNAWRFTQELTELYPLCYLYHEGDVVYIGADKYEISDLGEDAVSLRNPEFPLFGTEMSRAEFEEKLRENPMNDHLKTVITEKQETRSPAEGKDRLYFIFAVPLSQLFIHAGNILPAGGFEPDCLSPARHFTAHFRKQL